MRFSSSVELTFIICSLCWRLCCLICQILMHFHWRKVGLFVGLIKKLQVVRTKFFFLWIESYLHQRC